MVLPPLVSILVAAAVALLSTGIVVLHKKRVPLLLAARDGGKNQSEKVLFHITPSQRESLLAGHGLNDMNTTLDVRDMFNKEGYVIVRGLLNENMLERLSKAGNVFVKQQASAVPQTFSALRFGPVYLSAPSPNTNDTENDESLSAFREVSMESAIPSFIATVLLDLQPSSQTLRVLKDVFLAKGNETDYCGWHVDDQTFWPITYDPTTSGVNAWIAMDDVPAKHGGGLAVSPKSHVADWRQKAYQTIGSTPTYPDEGYEDPKDMFENYKTTTCNLQKAAPKLAQQIDESMHVFDFQKGDVLIHTRWLFHRSVPLSQEGMAYFQEQKPMIRRYSIRYEVGDARLLKGFTMEPSIVLNKENAGKTLDAVSEDASPWYPQCWPDVSKTEMARLYEITEEQLPAYEPLKKGLFEQVLPYFRKS